MGTWAAWTAPYVAATALLLLMQSLQALPFNSPLRLILDDYEEEPHKLAASLGPLSSGARPTSRGPNPIFLITRELLREVLCPIKFVGSIGT